MHTKILQKKAVVLVLLNNRKVYKQVFNNHYIYWAFFNAKASINGTKAHLGLIPALNCLT